MTQEDIKVINDISIPSGLVLQVCRGIGGKIERGPVFFKDHPSDKRGWRPRGYRTSDVVIEVKSKGRVIAGLAYDYKGIKNGVMIESHGTYVSKKRRGLGLAGIMWKWALKEESAVRVKMEVISDLGMTLAESLESKFPDIMWSISQGGSRDLRKLKKKSA